MIIFWKIQYVDRKQTETKEVVAISGEKSLQNVKKRGERSLYINTDDLSARNRIAFDIALERQKIVGDNSYFIFLRHLFIEGDWTKIKDVTSIQSVMATDYFEDEEGHLLTEQQFVEEVCCLPKMIRTHKGIYVPKNLSGDTARSLGVAELVPMRKDDFHFSDQDIEVLNTFIHSVMKLQNCSLKTQKSPLVLENNVIGWRIRRNITDEQYLSSIAEFRKLYMEREPACFLKAVKLLCDRRRVQHPILNIMSEQKKMYDRLCSHKISEDYFIKHLLNNLNEVADIPNGKELIDAMLYVDCIHQGDNETKEKRNKILQDIPVTAIVEYSFYILILNLADIIIFVGNIAFQILSFLGKTTEAIPPVRLSEAEKSFHIFLKKKSLELAEVIWQEQGHPDTGILQYQNQALHEIMERFHIEKIPDTNN